MRVSWTPKQNFRVKRGCSNLYMLLLFCGRFTEFNETGAEGRPGLISRHPHTTRRPAETLSVGQAACVPSARSPVLPCRLSFARAPARLAQQPQQDSIKPCASCVIPTSCTQGRECSAVFVCRGGPVSSPVPMSQQLRTGEPKNIQLCTWKPRRLFWGWNRNGSQLVFIKQLAPLKQPPHIDLTLVQCAEWTADGGSDPRRCSWRNGSVCVCVSLCV